MSYTKEDILRIAEEKDVKFIRLQFTDIFGQMKNVAITRSQLSKALNNECMFDGSSIEGFVRINESDMYLRPDYNSFTILPWKDGVARLICDVYCSDGSTPFLGDPRNVLKKVVKEAADMGYTFNVGPECEFFLFELDEEGNPTTNTNDVAGYFDMGPADQGEQCRRDICLALEEMGFEIEASHHECAEGQHEIDFDAASALKAADTFLSFKSAVRSVSHTHGVYASFMPKPLKDACGNGMHITLTIHRNDEEPDEATLRNAAAGIMRYIREMAVFTNTTVNSYARLGEFSIPRTVTWSTKEGAQLFRLYESSAEGVTLRAADCECNPYYVFGLLI